MFIYDPEEFMRKFIDRGSEQQLTKYKICSLVSEVATLQDIVRYLASEGADRLESCSTRDTIVYMRP